LRREYPELEYPELTSIEQYLRSRGWEGAKLSAED
jgi:hypothetical protein